MFKKLTKFVLFQNAEYFRICRQTIDFFPLAAILGKVLNYTIYSLKHLFVTFTSLASAYRMIVFVIVPPVIPGRIDWFMPKIEDDNVVRHSHYRTPGLRQEKQFG